MKTFLIGIIFVMAIAIAAIFATPTKHTSYYATPTPVVATTYIGGDRDMEAANIVLYALLVVGTIMVVVVSMLAFLRKKEEATLTSEWIPEQTPHEMLIEIGKEVRQRASVGEPSSKGLFADKKPEHITPVRGSSVLVDRTHEDRRFPYNRSGNRME